MHGTTVKLIQIGRVILKLALCLIRPHSM